MNTLDLFQNEPRFDTYKSGETIFTEGDPGDMMYVVVDGSVKLSVTGRTVEKVGRGGVFGEMALISVAPRSASAIAVADCSLVAITRERFNMLVRGRPEFALEIMSVMANRLRSMDRRL